MGFTINNSILAAFYFLNAVGKYILLLRWCRALELFGSQIPVAKGGFELRISCIRSSYLTRYLVGSLGTWVSRYLVR